MQHDAQVGGVPDRLDRLQIADNTIVVFTTDNGAMVAWYPDGGATPFRGETATTWEGGVRVPLLIRWPGRIEAGSVSNGIQAMEDLFTTLAPAAGAGDVVTRLKAEAGVCIDGVNNLAHWTEGVPSARNWNIYCNEGDLTAVRIGPWKSHLQEREGFFDYLRPSAKVFNLRSDPFEHHGGQQADDFAMKMGFAWGGQVRDLISSHFATFEECPPRQAGGSLRVEVPRPALSGAPLRTGFGRVPARGRRVACQPRAARSAACETPMPGATAALFHISREEVVLRTRRDSWPG